MKKGIENYYRTLIGPELNQIKTVVKQLYFRKKEGKESTYEEMSMDDFMNHPIFMDPNHIPTQEEIDQSDILSSLQAMKYCDLGELFDYCV